MSLALSSFRSRAPARGRRRGGPGAARVVRPEVSKAAEKSEWLSLVIGALLVAFVCVGAFIGSKRGHID